jgi:hypothetical protein
VLTVPEVDEEEMMGGPFTQIGSPIASLWPPSACRIACRCRQHKARLE